jgi:hypothetical protein
MAKRNKIQLEKFAQALATGVKPDPLTRGGINL